jgi:hypothetical protein
MALAEDDVIVGLCSRVASRNPGDDIFYHQDHVQQWPPGALQGLIAAGLLIEATDASSIVCRGCHERCNRPVENMQVTCELRDDVSVIPIRPERLKRWKSNQRLFSAFVGQQLGTRVKNADYKIGRFKFQDKRFDGIRTSLSLEFSSRQAILKLGGKDYRLEDLIVWRRGRPVLDRDEVTKLLADDGAKATTYQSSSLGRTRQKKNREDRNDEWQRMANRIKAERPGLGKEQISEEIFGYRTWKGVFSAKTIARNIRVYRK